MTASYAYSYMLTPFTVLATPLVFLNSTISCSVLVYGLLLNSIHVVFARSSDGDESLHADAVRRMILSSSVLQREGRADRVA